MPERGHEETFQGDAHVTYLDRGLDRQVYIFINSHLIVHIDLCISLCEIFTQKKKELLISIEPSSMICILKYLVQSILMSTIYFALHKKYTIALCIDQGINM